MKRLLTDLGFATAGAVGWLLILPLRIKPNDREALLLATFAWFGLLIALVALFPEVK